MWPEVFTIPFLDAPLGKIQVLGRAPGFEPAKQDRFVNQGLRLSVIMVLEKDDAAAAER